MIQRQFIITFILFAFCTASTTGAADISLENAIEESTASIVKKLPVKTRVAVVAMEAESENLAAYIMDEITSVFVDSDIEVAERNNLGYALKELKLQASGLADDKNAAQVGKFLTVKYIITGQLVHLGNSYRYRLSAINVENGIQEANERINVKDDGALKKMIAALNNNKQHTREAKYFTVENATPKTSGRFIDHGLLFSSQGNYDMAIEVFSEAIKLDPNLAGAYFQRGWAYFHKKDYDHAIADYTQSLKLDPNNVEAYMNRGVAYMDNGSYDRAISDYNQAIKLDPNDAKSYCNRGLAYDEKGEYDHAIADCTEAIKIDPNYANAYYNRGIVYKKKGNYNRAISDLTEAIRLAPSNSWYKDELQSAKKERGW